VHFHCLQGISASVLDACTDRGLPFVITVHDAWWICERQFMVTREGRYCAQQKIDLHICQACIPTADHLQERWEMSHQRLAGAARLLFPSDFHRDLHLANGIDPHSAVVNRNGVRWPARPRPPRQAGVLRFGYVGGNDGVKGIHLIREAFEKLARTDFSLTLTDNTTNMGLSTMHTNGWKIRGELHIIPAYRQDTMDDFFESIDVLLFPSQWKESFGLTVREALIRDVWVIATDGGGTVEDIFDGVNGTILPFTATATDLREAIEALLARPDRLASHVNPHKQRVTTYQAQAAELHAILSEVIRKPHTNP
jgi:glycosyltransferase involved in cell wall biosynthesis